MKLENTLRRSNSIFGIVFTFFCFLSFTLTIFSESFVPEQFTRDSTFIENRMNSRITGFSDSFQTMVNIYRFFGIDNSTIYLRIIEWFIFFIAIYISIHSIPHEFRTLNILMTSIFYLILIPFYGSLFTKELLISSLICIFLILRRSSNVNIMFLYAILIATYALTIRSYYFLTLFFFCLYILLDSRFLTSKLSFSFPILILAFGATVDSIFQLSSKFLDFNLFNIRIETQTGFKVGVNSIIYQDPLSQNLIANIINFGKVAVQFLFPVSILESNVYTVVVFFIVLFMVWQLVLQYAKRSDIKSYDAIFLWSYFSVSLIFEPDLGSFIRHSFPFIPIILMSISDRLACEKMKSGI